MRHCKGVDNMSVQSILSRITATSEIFCGKPIIRAMRISVESILSLLAQGASMEDLKSIRNLNRKIFWPVSPMSTQS